MNAFTMLDFERIFTQRDTSTYGNDFETMTLFKLVCGMCIIAKDWHKSSFKL